MYFPFFSLRHGGKRTAAQPQTIDSEFPHVLLPESSLARDSPIISSFFIFQRAQFLGGQIRHDGFHPFFALPAFLCSGAAAQAALFSMAGAAGIMRSRAAM